MIKLTVLYLPPDDVDAFLKHYREVHLPLVRAVPGVARIVAQRVRSSPGAKEPRYFLVAEMHFADQASFDAAMRSDENKRAGRDLMAFSQGKFVMLVTDELET